MFQKRQWLWMVVSIIAATALLLFGLFSLLWALFCFLGGPDGKIGSLESIEWGLGFSLFGILVTVAGVFFARAGLKAKRVIKQSKQEC
jgi:membrane protein implicated in regulation of membrane protease activity